MTFYDSVSDEEFGQTLATGSTHVWSNLFSDPIVGFQYQIDSANKFLQITPIVDTCQCDMGWKFSGGVI